MGRKNEAGGLSDPRFAHLTSDPRYTGLKREERKVVLEKRFAGILNDPRFARASNIDKRGRNLKKKTDATLHHLYELEKDGEEEEEKEKKVTKKSKEAPKKKQSKPAVEEEEEEEEGGSDEEEEENEEGSDGEEDSDDEETGDKPIKLVDLARGGGGALSSDEEEDEDEAEWALEEIGDEHGWGELDREARRVEWASRRLAICNLDWDSLYAEDLFMLVSSFKPLGGKIERLSVYMSDFGKERMDAEEKAGPQIEFMKDDDDKRKGKDSDEEEGGELDEKALKKDPKRREAIRKYQMERLKFYYAVLECDSEQTASAVYESCDGIEYEHSGLKMDMRFVPDDMTFDESRLKDRIGDEEIQAEKYKPSVVGNTALTLSKVKLTWEDKDVNRERKMREAFEEDADLGTVAKDLIANSDESDDEAFEGPRVSAKERLALLLGGGEDEEGDMEVKWEADEDAQEEKSKKKKDKKSSFETFLEKRKSKRKERKAHIAELKKKAKEAAVEEEEKEKEQKKGKKDKKKAVEKAPEKEDSQVVVDDRFKALFTDSAYTIDAASGLSKSAALMEKQNAVRRKRKAETTPAAAGQSLVEKLKKKSAKWAQ